MYIELKTDDPPGLSHCEVIVTRVDYESRTKDLR